MQGRPRFLDASIFINWLKTDPKRALHDETALISGYILQKIEFGEPAITIPPVKDEVCIWLSRYRATSLQRFLELLTGYTSLEIINPTLDDQAIAANMFGKYRLGFVDLMSLSVMKRLGLTEIYSSDTGFDSVTEVKRIFSQLKDEEGFKEFLALITKRTRRFQ